MPKRRQDLEKSQIALRFETVEIPLINVQDVRYTTCRACEGRVGVGVGLRAGVGVGVGEQPAHQVSGITGELTVLKHVETANSRVLWDCVHTREI